jgi:N-acetylneuraminate lyase
MTGVSFPVADFLTQAADRIPSLAGVKYTHEDLPDYRACVGAANGRYDILFGRDELLLEGTAAGALGAVGSTYNYAAPLYLRILAALTAGHAAEARALQDTAIKMIAICNGIGVTHLAASKALMAMLGVDCGPVRLPLIQPTTEQLAGLRAQLTEIGFFDFACRASK